MGYKRYIVLFYFLFCLVLFVFSIVSFVVDPGSIYVRKRQASLSDEYAVHLLKSKRGLLWQPDLLNERDIKSSLVRQDSNVSCVVIGSSHVMQISSFGKKKSLTHVCPKLLNLGVSGATLEDYLSFAWLLVTNKFSPRTIVIGVDPWALNFGRDGRWERYPIFYENMLRLLSQGKKVGYGGRGLFWAQLKNLINPEYVYKSIKIMIVDWEKVRVKWMNHNTYHFINAPTFNEDVGYESYVLRPDGSLIYSRKYIQSTKNAIIPSGGKNYKLNETHEKQYSADAVNLFEQLIMFLKNRGYTVILLMTPYHHNVWHDEKSVTTRALLQMEPLIRRIGKKNHIQVIGSYNPNQIGCLPNEFFDFMHPKAECLAKIRDK